MAIAVGTAVLTVAAYRGERARVDDLRASLAAELASQEQTHEERLTSFRLSEAALHARIEAEEAAHRAMLTNREFLSGELAAAYHSSEWHRRMRHDPALANSPLETNLLRMARIGQDPAVAHRTALLEVARLATPAKSQIEVTPSGNQFQIRVAYPMSSVSDRESGAVTKHKSNESMRREIRELSARLVRELFDYCGARGIERLSVSCNHAIRRSSVADLATEEERRYLRRRAEIVMGNLYRVSVDGRRAAAVADWREIPISRVMSMMVVELDRLDDLEIEEGLGGPGVDPDMPLEF